MVEIRNFVRTGFVAVPAIHDLELPTVRVVRFMAGGAASSPIGLLQQGMIEAIHQESVGFVAEVTPRWPEGPFMRIVRPMADGAGTGIVEPEHEAAVILGSRFVTGGAGCDGVGP
jgi:hypothetical protein